MKQIKVAVTGSIGSGKSIFTNYLKEKGYPVLYADDISNRILAGDKQAREQVIKEFGEEAFLNDAVNKKFLAGKVFSNPNELKKLNSILHPKVIGEIDKIINDKYKNEKIIFIETAIVYEAGIEEMFDYVILIAADEKIRLERILKGNKFTKEDFLKRDKVQLPDNKKIEKADFVFFNNTNKEELFEKADLMLLTLKSLNQ